MSPSASVAVGVAVIVWLVVGLEGEMTTLVTTGAELATVTEWFAVRPFTVPSLGVTSTRTTSPLSPLPATDRSNVLVGAPTVVVPLTFQT